MSFENAKQHENMHEKGVQEALVRLDTLLISLHEPGAEVEPEEKKRQEEALFKATGDVLDIASDLALLPESHPQAAAWNRQLVQALATINSYRH